MYDLICKYNIIFYIYVCVRMYVYMYMYDSMIHKI